MDKSEQNFNSGDLKEIIQRTGGKISLTLKQDVLELSLTAEEDLEENSKTLKKKNKYQNLFSHKWILDSISNAKVLDFNKYRV